MSQVIAVRAEVTTGAPFTSDKNGNYPLILTPVKGGRLEKGGLMNGSIAKRLGVKSGGIYVLQITATKAGEYTNYNYSVVSDLTNSVANEAAKMVVGQMFGEVSIPAQVETPAEEVAEDNSPL